ncbi:probable disease resistance protein At4g19530 [Daucus carota subsp. sativus]|nr:PREDICTED: protein PHLOEM PROTEIN 2-LIKE A6-like [Daucus carota subsp. sativus]
MAIEDCDVFLSFRGDTRNNFTCYLYEELKRQGFQPFMDRANIGIGDDIHGIIKKAIKYSKSAIVVISDNYPSSSHCLNELVHVLERNRTSKYFIIPIFYYVEARNVKYQLGKFGAAFEHVKKRESNEKVKEWRAALAEVGDILAEEINEKDPRTESKIIADIVASFAQKYSEHYLKWPESKASSASIISPQNKGQNVPTEYCFDIEEGLLQVTKDNAQFRTNKYENMTFRSWMKDWIIHNPKFFIVIVIVVIFIIISTVVTSIYIHIESSAVDTVSTIYKDLSTTLKDLDAETTWDPKNFPVTLKDAEPWAKIILTAFKDLDSENILTAFKDLDSEKILTALKDLDSGTTESI